MIKEMSDNLRMKEESHLKSQGILIGRPNVKVLPLLRSNLMVLVSAKMLYQELMENFLRSRRSQGKAKENEIRKEWPPCQIQESISNKWIMLKYIW